MYIIRNFLINLENVTKIIVYLIIVYQTESKRSS